MVQQRDVKGSRRTKGLYVLYWRYKLGRGIYSEVSVLVMENEILTDAHSVGVAVEDTTYVEGST